MLGFLRIVSLPDRRFSPMPFPYPLSLSMKGQILGEGMAGLTCLSSDYHFVRDEPTPQTAQNQ